MADARSEHPSVSIIIPTYNRAGLVEGAIHSALTQGPDVEVIVVDDGSTDHSWQVIEGFQDVIAVRSDNRGVSAARNLGLARARAEYVQFLDSDDRLPAGSVESMLALATALEPGQIAVGTAALYPSESAATAYGFAAQVDNGVIASELLYRFTLPASLALFPRKALVEAGGFEEGLSIGEDYALAAHLHRLGYAFVQVPVIACLVNDHGGARLTRELDGAGYDAIARTIDTAWAGMDRPTRAARIAIGRKAWTAARDASRAGHRPQAERLFAMARMMGGRAAEVAPPALRALYRLTSPYLSERIAAAAKSMLGRP